MKNTKGIGWLLGAALAVTPMILSAKTTDKPLAERVRHEVVMLPWYSLFDDISYQVEGSKVILTGQVVRPTLKKDAENAVKSIAGVSEVENKIEILPPSPFDDRIRLAVLRSVYGSDGLLYYGLGASPSIHIMVKNGHVTLAGVVSRPADKALAGVAANMVPGVFSVTNDLQVRQ
jgi:hyperosmotically inducible protein